MMDEVRPIHVLAATPEHAAYIADMHGALFERAWDAEGVRRLLEHPASVALVAQIGSAAHPAGFAMAHLTADEMEILSVGVRRDWHRQGIGRALVAGLIDVARPRDVKRVFLDVAESNVAAVALYSGLGFTGMGRRKNYYSHADGTREDALLMVHEM